MYTSKVPDNLEISPHAKPVIRFAIVGNKRTGSSHLGSLLDSHPDIAFWDDEILEPDNEFDRSHYDHPSQFLEEAVFRVPTTVVGFKMMWESLERWPDVWEMLAQLDIWLIHTVRENRLDSFISFKLATINDSFTSSYGDWRTLSFIADYHEALEWFERTKERDERIRALAVQHSRPRLELEYKTLCTTPELALDFLRLPRTTLSSLYVKQRTNSQAASIANYEELRSLFSGTQWISFFIDKEGA